MQLHLALSLCQDSETRPWVKWIKVLMRSALSHRSICKAVWNIKREK